MLQTRWIMTQIKLISDFKEKINEIFNSERSSYEIMKITNIPQTVQQEGTIPQVLEVSSLNSENSASPTQDSSMTKNIREENWN